MSTYYTAICVLMVMALTVLCILVRENDHLDPQDKALNYVTYTIIAISMLAEWTGVALNGRSDIAPWVIRLVKCFDYILTPMAGGALAAQLRVQRRWNRILDMIVGVVLLANAILQVISLFTGWMISIDEFNCYTHGPLYPLYAASYGIIIVVLFVQFMLYGSAYRKQNRLSLWAAVTFIVAAIVIQEVLGGFVRTAYLGLAVGAALLYIHASEFSQQRADERIRKQQKQLVTDALTGALSRHAYALELESISRQGSLPTNLAVFSIDVNGLKQVNDTLGHDAGDELLCGAAQCIMRSADGLGKCYRIGGDEFIILAHVDARQADELLRRLERETSQWSGPNVSELSLSVAYALASQHEGLSFEELIKKSDEAMYAVKAAYYRKRGQSVRR